MRSGEVLGSPMFLHFGFPIDLSLSTFAHFSRFLHALSGHPRKASVSLQGNPRELLYRRFTRQAQTSLPACGFQGKVQELLGIIKILLGFYQDSTRKLGPPRSSQDLPGPPRTMVSC